MEKEKSIEKLKRAILGELYQDYPEGAVYGKVEYFLKSRGYAVNVLVNHGILERLSQAEKDKLLAGRNDIGEDWYRLSSKGVDLAISMSQLDYAQEMRKFTLAIIIIGALALLIGLNALIFQILQYFK